MIHPITRGGLSLALLASLAVGFASPRDTLGEDSPKAPSIEVDFPANPLIPKRELTFKVSKEELSIALFAADPKLLDQKYIATLVLPLPDRSITYQSYTITPKGKLGPLYWSAMFGRVQLRVPNSSFIRDRTTLFKSIAENTPAEHKPPAEIMARLLDHERHFRVVGDGGNVTRTRSGDLQLQLLGPTVESVKAMSHALLDLYDHGLSRPIQEELIAEMRQQRTHLQAMVVAFNAERDKLGPLSKQLEKSEPISVESIVDLRTQQRLIAVDIAGAQARINACAKILKRKDIRGKKASEQVELIKITAEIELVGLTARQAAIGKIVEDGNQRRNLALQLDRQNSVVTSHSKSIRNSVRRLSSHEEARKRFMPVAIRNNLILIQPIKWESAKPSSGFGGGVSRGR